MLKEITSLEQKTLLLPREFQGFQELSDRDGGLRLIQIFFPLIHTVPAECLKKCRTGVKEPGFEV